MEQVRVRDLFIETKNVIEDYKEKVSKLDEQERELNAELIALQDEMTANILDQESASVSERVYLRIQSKEINQRTEIIQVILEELAEERTELKIEFTPIYRQSLRNDTAYRSCYGATDIAEKYKYLMLKEISDIGSQMQKQYFDIAEDIYEVFEDSEVRKEFPRLEYVFHQDQYVPAFGWFGDSVISKNEVFNASRGYKPVKPKHMEEVKEEVKDVE